MQKSLKAMINHLTSSDTNPKHDDCPKHRPRENRQYKSYCFWQRYKYLDRRAHRIHIANQKKKKGSKKSGSTINFYSKDYVHRPEPKHSSMHVRLDYPEDSLQYQEFMKIMDRLMDKELLSRCVDNKTQNPNESFHNKIWIMCPKAKFFAKPQMDFAMNQSILIHHFKYTRLRSSLGV